MEKTQPIVALSLKAIAMAMATASIALSILKVQPSELYLTLLAIGLFALSLASITETRQPQDS